MAFSDFGVDGPTISSAVESSVAERMIVTEQSKRKAGAPSPNLARQIDLQASAMLPASVFANQRKRVGLVLAVAEIVLLALAFEAAYQTRLHITFERSFFMEGRRQVLLIAFSILFWLGIGASSRIYEHLDSAQARRIVRATIRHCFLEAVCIVFFEYLLRWDLSRSFLLLFFLYGFSFILLFRLNSPRLVGAFSARIRHAVSRSDRWPRGRSARSGPAFG